MTIVFESGDAAAAQLKSWAAVVWASTTTGKKFGAFAANAQTGAKKWQAMADSQAS